jgi:hypothetical protein
MSEVNTLLFIEDDDQIRLAWVIARMSDLRASANIVRLSGRE